MDEGRIADIKELEKARKTAPDKETLHNIRKVERTIREEQHDGYLRDARKSLVREARRNRKGNVRDIQERLAKKRDKNMGIGRTFFFFDKLPWQM